MSEIRFRPGEATPAIISTLANNGRNRCPVVVEIDEARPMTDRITPVLYQGMQSIMYANHAFSHELETNLLNGVTDYYATPEFLRPSTNVAVFSYKGDAAKGFLMRDCAAKECMYASVFEPLNSGSGYKVFTQRGFSGHLMTDQQLKPGQTVIVETTGWDGSEFGNLYYRFKFPGDDDEVCRDSDACDEIERSLAGYSLLEAEVLGFNDPVAPTIVRMSHTTGMYNMFMPISHVSRYTRFAINSADHISRSIDMSVEGIVLKYDKERSLGTFSLAAAQDLVLAGIRNDMDRAIDVVLTGISRDARENFIGYKIWHRGLVKGFLHRSYVGLSGADPESLIGSTRTVTVKEIKPYSGFFDIIAKIDDEPPSPIPGPSRQSSTFGNTLRAAFQGQ